MGTFLYFLTWGFESAQEVVLTVLRTKTARVSSVTVSDAAVSTCRTKTARVTTFGE